MILQDKQLSNITKFSGSHVKNIFEYGVTDHT